MQRSPHRPEAATSTASPDYYEIHGDGEPLLLLHGGLGSIEMFGPVLPMLAEGRQVIGVELHGHGRTPLGDRAISLIDMGDDMAVLLDALDYEPDGRMDIPCCHSQDRRISWLS